MLMFIVANLVGSTIQITTLPLPVLSTLQASGLVFNSICASLLLHEPFTRYSFVGTVLVALGAALIALYGAIPEPSHSLDGLLLLLGRSEFIGWIIATFVVVFCLLGVTWILSRLSNPSSKISNRYKWAGNASAGGSGAIRLKLIRGMSYGCISGILSAHTLLLAKSAVELLVTTFTSANQFLRYQSWLILLGLVILALSQLYYLHRGLKLCSTSVLYPFVFCIYNITAILDGLIYFHQTSRLRPLAAGLITLGTAILLSGVVALSWRLADHHHHPHPSSSSVSIPASHRHSTPTTPAVPATAFAPGMGLIDSPTPSPTPSSSLPSSPHPDDDEDEDADEEEEALILNGEAPVSDRPHERTPLLHARTPARRQTLAAPAAELWADLLDAGPVYTSPTAGDRGGTQRRASGTVQSRASRSRARSAAGILGRSRPDAGVDGGGGGADDDVGEEEIVGRRSRRVSTPGLPWGRRTSWRGSVGRKGRQDALGGWFKLGWWRRRVGRGRGGGESEVGAREEV
ncbi:MAG: hypothetical protein M1821_003138 [Bathelium mastoideum]|nr:MAG: hypothetical protein M1821_003138 [Bathelium mastoideum]